MIRKAIIVMLTLAAVGTGVLWASSLGQGYISIYETGGSTFVVLRTHGEFRFVWQKPTTDSSVPPSYQPARQYSTIFGANIPLWIPFILFASYPTVAFIRGPLRRYRRRKRGLCVKCGYNLTGLTKPRCPECGHECRV